MKEVNLPTMANPPKREEIDINPEIEIDSTGL